MQVLPSAWPMPPRVRACTTLRAGGRSTGPYRGLNLAAHVGDDPAAVTANRRALAAALALPGGPVWLDQVHGTAVVDASRAAPGTAADAAWTCRPGVVCAVLTADCLPVVLCDRAGTRVAVIHAGWRGLAAGIVPAAVAALGGGELLAWLGPAIGPGRFEVGGEVRERFMAADRAAAACFTATGPAKWHADLYGLARLALAAAGVASVYGGGHCTYDEADRFYSFRRDGTTGRMATLVWLQPEAAADGAERLY